MDYHQPVLLRQVIELLEPREGKTYLDGTLGHGGHTIPLLSAGAKVYGLDQDPISLKIATDRITSLGLDRNFIPIHGNFSNIQKLLPEKVDGLFLDLGLNSSQQKAIGRGFSFNDHSSLDMRLDPISQTETAENIVNTADYQTLYDIFTKYAQEQYSKPLIIRIIKERQSSPIKSGQRLADIIRAFYSERHLRTSTDPATKIFMALRIAVNQELTHLKQVINQIPLVVKPNGVACIITFHSGEDRLLKRLIPTISKGIKPDYQEVKINPLSRSATLRSYKIN